MILDVESMDLNDSNHIVVYAEQLYKDCIVVRDPDALRFNTAFVEKKYLISVDDNMYFMLRNAPYICEVKSSHL